MSEVPINIDAQELEKELEHFTQKISIHTFLHGRKFIYV